MSNTFNVSRSIWSDEQFPKEPFTKREAWLWLISESSWKDRQYRIGKYVFDLKRGQLAASTRGLAAIWQWTDSKVRRFLDMLEKCGNIDALAERGATVITVCNYEVYQSGRRDSDAPTDDRPTQQRRTTDAIQKQEIPEVIPDKKKEPKGSQKKGTRLPDHWTPSQRNFQEAQACGLTTDEVRHEADKFRDYWISAAGAKAAKLDWDATWRNWCRTAAERKPSGRGRSMGNRSNGEKLANAFDDLQREVRTAQDGPDPWSEPSSTHAGATIDLEGIRGGS